MTHWEQVHQRYRLIHDVAGDVAKYGTRALADWRPTINSEYGGLDGFLRDVQRRYLTAVEARLDAVIEACPADPKGPVAEALDEVAEAHSDVWRLLREFAGDPALAAGDIRLRRSLLAAGVDPRELMHDRRTGAEKVRKPVRSAALRPNLGWLH